MWTAACFVTGRDGTRSVVGPRAAWTCLRAKYSSDNTSLIPNGCFLSHRARVQHKVAVRRDRMQQRVELLDGG